jgi:predicted metal-dependent hydrolase
MGSSGRARAAEAFTVGVLRFDAIRFFEAHEAFEQVWRSPETEPADRPFWKGVTQVAVGFCHVQRGNARGALTLLDRAIRNLEAFPSPHLGVDTRALVGAARAIADAVRSRGIDAALAFPAFPRAG